MKKLNDLEFAAYAKKASGLLKSIKSLLAAAEQAHVKHLEQDKAA